MTKTKEHKIAKQEQNEIVKAPSGQLSSPVEFTGLEEVSGIEDCSMGYFSLRQDDEVEGSFPGALIDTIDNTVYDIRKDKGTPVTIVPLSVTKDFEIYKPLFASNGTLNDKEFGEKLFTVKKDNEIVQTALSKNCKDGTRRSYIVSDEATGEVNYLVQQVNRVLVWFNEDFYVMSLRGSKLNFFKKWNKIMLRKEPKPICKHAYKLYSVKETNPIVNSTYWNFAVEYEGLVDEETAAKTSDMAIKFSELYRKGEVKIIGADDE
jgi:hypothetical protein